MTARKGTYVRPSRADNMKHLIAELRKGPLNRFQVSELIHISPENAKKHLCELKREGVAEFAPADSDEPQGQKCALYALAGDERAIRAFIVKLDNPVPMRTRLERAAAAKARSENPVRVKHPKSDPLALPPDFFKPASLDGEALPRAVAAPVAPSRFPAPSNFTFEVPA